MTRINVIGARKWALRINALVEHLLTRGYRVDSYVRSRGLADFGENEIAAAQMEIRAADTVICVGKPGHNTAYLLGFADALARVVVIYAPGVTAGGQTVWLHPHASTLTELLVQFDRLGIRPAAAQSEAKP
jgi:hypothetical protein